MESQKESDTRILEWVAISSSRGSSQPRVRTRVFCVGRQIFFFFQPATREAALGRGDCFPQYKDSNANIFLKHLHRHTPKYSLTCFPGTCDLVMGRLTLTITTWRTMFRVLYALWQWPQSSGVQSLTLLGWTILNRTSVVMGADSHCPYPEFSSIM